MILDNRRITIGEIAEDVGICQVIFVNILSMKHVTAKIVQKFAKFLAKTMSPGHRLEDVGNVQRRSRFVKKGHNC